MSKESLCWNKLSANLAQICQNFDFMWFQSSASSFDHKQHKGIKRAKRKEEQKYDQECLAYFSQRAAQLLSFHILPFFSALSSSKRQKSFVSNVRSLFLFLSPFPSSHTVSVPLHPPKPASWELVQQCHDSVYHVNNLPISRLKKGVSGHLMPLCEDHLVNVESLIPWLRCHICGETLAESFPQIQHWPCEPKSTCQLGNGMRGNERSNTVMCEEMYRITGHHTERSGVIYQEHGVGFKESFPYDWNN